MDSNNQSGRTKRQVLKGMGMLGAGGMTWLAGCTGGEQETEETTEESTETTTEEVSGEQVFNPFRGIVDNLVPAAPGGGTSASARAYAENMEPHYPGDIRTTVTHRPGAEGNIMHQEVYDGPEDGGLLGHSTINFLNDAHLSVDFIDQADFHMLGGKTFTARTIMVSPHSRDLDDHFEWTWDDLIQSAQEKSLNCAVVAADQFVIPELLFRQDDRMTRGETYDFVNFEGGAPARQAFLAGDVDIYVAGLTHGYAAEYSEFYKAQWVVANPDTLDPNVVETYSNLESYEGTVSGVPEEGWITNAPGVPEEEAEIASKIGIGSYLAFAPPATPDEIVDVHREAFQLAAEESGTRDQMEQFFHPARVTYLDGETVRGLAQDRLTQFEENELLQEILDEM
jgi:tripartite-type tricarboxylate transporter receptor subunit TctC